MMSDICADPLSLVLYYFSSDVAQRCQPFLGWIVERSSVTFVEYLQVFGKTMLLEAAFYFWLLRALSWPGKLLALVVANLATHPFVYFGFPALCDHFDWTYATMLWIAEIFAPAIEILVLTKLFSTPLKPTALWIVLANLFSWWVGVLMLYG